MNESEIDLNRRVIEQNNLIIDQFTEENKRILQQQEYLEKHRGEEPWAFVCCDSCGANVPLYASDDPDSTVKCGKCGRGIRIGKPIGKEEGQGYLWTQRGRSVPLPRISEFDSKAAVEAWKKHFDPYMLDIVGFEKFLEFWRRWDPNIDWPDFVPPCVQCVKYDVCGDLFYRKGGDKVDYYVAAPRSHLWKPLKRPRKGTSCEHCASVTDLMAYRNPYNHQTLCRECLEAGRKGFTRSRLVCDHIVYRS